MSEDHYNGILREIEDLRKEMNRRLDEIRKDVTYEMKLSHSKMSNRIDNNDREISAQKKIMATIAGTIGLAVLYAVLRSIGL